MSRSWCSTIWCAGRGATRRVSTSRPPPNSTPSPRCRPSSRAAACTGVRSSRCWWWPGRRSCSGGRCAGSSSSWSAAPPAGRFAGFNDRTLIVVTFLISGALAGLAGIIEVSATVNHLQPNISPGYGFTAIIVAFLGRLHPVGILIASLFLALTFIGGESAQILMKVPLDLTKVFQGILLFYVLACDTLILYRFRLIFAAKVRSEERRVGKECRSRWW